MTHEEKTIERMFKCFDRDYLEYKFHRVDEAYEAGWKAAYEASGAEHIPALVEALEYWNTRYESHNGLEMLQDDPLGDCFDKAEQALDALPEELRGE